MLDLFLQYIQYEKKYSAHTLLSYKFDIKQFTTFLQKRNKELTLEKAETDDIRLWAVDLMEKKLSATSVNRKLSVLKSYYKFLLKNKKIKKNPALVVVAPKKCQQIPNFFTESEMNSDFLHELQPNETHFETERNSLIVETFFQTGIRRAELISLKDSDIDFFRKTIKVLGKRKKERLVPFGKALHEFFLEYLEVRNKEIQRLCDNFFVMKNGKKMYDKAVYNIVCNRMKMVSTLVKHSPHVLRHTFATTMLNNGTELNSVKELLGHTSLASTQVYTHTTFEELQKIYRQAHPRAENGE
jgi:integrase/recombinase XerC